MNGHTKSVRGPIDQFIKMPKTSITASKGVKKVRKATRKPLWPIFCHQGSAVIISQDGRRAWRVDAEACGCELVDKEDIDRLKAVYKSGASAVAPLDHPRFFRDWGNQRLIRSGRLAGNYAELVSAVISAGCPAGLWPEWGAQK